MRLNTLDEQEMFAFAHNLLSLYFEKRDMNTLSQHIEEHTSWIGTGEDELCGKLTEAGVALFAELEEYGVILQEWTPLHKVALFAELEEYGDYFAKQTTRADNQSLRAELNSRERQLVDGFTLNRTGEYL